MLTGESRPPAPARSAHAQSGQDDRELGVAATALYADLRPSPLLRQLLASSRGITGTTAGSISLVDPRRQRYLKVAEHGASCSLGHSFPLDEGVTGRVVGQRRPVVLRRYGDIGPGHLPAGHPAHRGAVVGVPIWWRGEVIGVNVGFAGHDRRFTAAEVDRLELLTQLAAAGIVHAGAADPAFNRHALEAGLDAAPAAREPASSDHTSGHAGHVGRAGHAAEEVTDGPSPFTRREREVLTLLARGASDRAVAEALVISHRTVEKHVASLLRKTATPSRTAAVMTCVEHGWLPTG